MTLITNDKNHTKVRGSIESVNMGDGVKGYMHGVKLKDHVTAAHPITLEQYHREVEGEVP
jgi:hypothetical protein